MPQTDVLFYCEEDSSVPVLEWLSGLHRQDRRAYNKCREMNAHLEQFGHELRRPMADLLRDGIYELRGRVGHVNYRLLYFFHGRNVAIVAHGLTKESEIPKRDLALAVKRKDKFQANPKRHTNQREEPDEKKID